MKQLLTITSIFLIISKVVFAQDDKIFHSTGAATFTDYMVAPPSGYVYHDSGNPPWTPATDVTYYHQFTGLSYFTFIYNFRYNLSEPSENSAFTASAIPAVGLFIAYSNGVGTGSDGFGSFNIPLMAGYEFGAGSTYNSTSNMGGFIRFGIEWTIAPVFALAKDQSAGDAIADLKTSWVEPAVQFGVRYWNKNNKLREINFKYGFGSSAPAGATDSEGDKIHSAKTLRLAWMLFLNY